MRFMLCLFSFDTTISIEMRLYTRKSLQFNPTDFSEIYGKGNAVGIDRPCGQKSQAH